MPSYIAKIKDKYLEWSTIADAPTTYGMTLEELREYIKEEYGLRAWGKLPERLERVEKSGTSCISSVSVEKLIGGNRAGDDGAELSLDEIYEKYCKGESQ